MHTSIIALAPRVAAGLARAWTGWRGSDFEGAVILTSSGQLEVAGLRPEDSAVWVSHLGAQLSFTRTVGGEARLIGPLLREWGQAINCGLELKVLAAKQAIGSVGNGRVRLARSTELDTVSTWISDFFRETSQQNPDWVNQAARQLIGEGHLYFWSEGSALLTMVAVVASTPRASRLSLAYTPPQLRGRGYATSCMRAITRLLLRRGAGSCCVHVRADAGTPQRLYRRTGYAEIGERLEGAIA